MMTVNDVSKLTGVTKMDFTAFDKKKLDDYAKRAKEQWGNTKEYQEFEEKAKGLTETQKNEEVNNFMMIFAEFGTMKDKEPQSEEVQLQVKKLQDFITEHYYTCSKEILAGVGKMYAAGVEFTENIGSYGGEGTAMFTDKAIEVYCKG